MQKWRHKEQQSATTKLYGPADEQSISAQSREKTGVLGPLGARARGSLCLFPLLLPSFS